MNNSIALFLTVFVSMLIGVMIGSIITSSVIYNSKAVSYYKGSVIIDKSKDSFKLDSCGNKKTIEATSYELSLYNLGDTIK